MKTVDIRFWNHRAALPLCGTAIVSRNCVGFVIPPVGDMQGASAIIDALVAGLKRTASRGALGDIGPPAPAGGPHSG